MKKILLSIFCLALLQMTQAQITIDRTNLPTAGVKLHVYSAEEVDLNLGTASDQTQEWDFSALQGEQLDSIQYVAVSATPYADSIGNTANFALNIDGEIGGALPLTNNYLFLKEESNGIYGNAIAVDALGEIIIMSTDNPELIYPFPIEYGMELHDTSNFQANLTSPVEGSVQRNTVKTIHSDAFGTVILEGDTTEVLRVYEEANVRDDFGSVSEKTEYRYYFYTNEPNHRHPLVSVLMDENRKIKLVTWITDPSKRKSVSDSTNTVDNSATDDGEASDTTNAIEEIKALQSILIFPNPVINTLSFSVENQVMNLNQIRIYNFLGQTVAQMNYTGQKSIDLSNLNKGSYFIEFVTKDGTRTTKKFYKSNF